MTTKTQPCTGPAGLAVTTSNATRGDQWGAVALGGAGATLTYSTAHPAHNNPTSQLHHYAGVAWAYTAFTPLTAANKAYAYAYLYLTANPPNNPMRLITFFAAGFAGCALQVNQDGTLSVLDGGLNPRGTSATPVPLNQLVRVELQATNLNAGTGDPLGRLFTNPESATPTETFGTTQWFLRGNFDEVGFGQPSGASVNLTTFTWDLYVADATWSDTAMPALPHTGNIGPTQYLINRALDPSMESGVSGAQSSTNGTLYPLTYDTNQKHSGTRSALQTRAASTPSNQIGGAFLSSSANTHALRIPAAPGETISAAAYVRTSVAATARVYMQFRDAAGALLSSNSTTAPLVPVPANTWTPVASSTVAPAGTAYLNVTATTFLPSSGTSVGGELTWFDSLIVNTGPTAYPYFDGRTPWCYWTATPDQSTSVRPTGPWTLWDGANEQLLTPAGVYDGSAIQPATFTDVAIVP